MPSSHVSLTQGRPTAITSTDFNVDSPQHFFKHSLPQDPASHGALPPNIYRWRLGLAHLQHDFCGLFDRADSLSARLSLLAKLDAGLAHWRDGIPVELRPEQEILCAENDYDDVVLLHLEYANMLRTIHWGSITAIPANCKELNFHSNPRIRASESICLSAAVSYVNILNRYNPLQLFRFSPLLTWP